MQPLDAFALVGDVMSWIGLAIGLPLLVMAMCVRHPEEDWVAIEIAVIERDGHVFARWFAGGDFHERRLRRHEPASAEEGWVDGVIRANDPSRLRIGEPLDPRRILWTVGIAFTSVGAVGLIVSFLPLFF